MVYKKYSTTNQGTALIVKEYNKIVSKKEWCINATVNEILNTETCTGVFRNINLK